MPLIRLLAALFLTLSFTGAAHAACQTGAATLSGGSASSYDVRGGQVPVFAGTAGFSCNGSILSVLSANSVRASATSLRGFRLVGPGGASVRYRLSADRDGSYPLSGGATVDYFDPALLRLLGILSYDNLTPPLFAALTEAANLAPGTYTDTVTIAWSWQVCRGIGLGGLCVLSESGTGTSVVTVTLVVTKDCRVSAPDLSFASAPLAAEFQPVRQSVAVDCSLNTPFAVSFTAGTSGASRPWRAMTGPRGARLEYNIYRPDGTVWDEASPLAGGTGTGALVPGQLQAYTARINPAQADPPAGTYSDTVSVVVTF